MCRLRVTERVRLLSHLAVSDKVARIRVHRGRIEARAIITPVHVEGFEHDSCKTAARSAPGVTPPATTSCPLPDPRNAFTKAQNPTNAPYFRLIFMSQTSPRAALLRTARGPAAQPGHLLREVSNSHISRWWIRSTAAGAVTPRPAA